MTPGRYNEGTSSRYARVEISIEGNELAIFGDGIRVHHSLDECKSHPPLGSLPIQITLPDGATIEIESAQAASLPLEKIFRSKTSNWIVRLERNWRGALLALLSIPLALTCFYLWGIPWVASHVAMQIPTRISASIGQVVLQEIDRSYCSASKLSAKRQKQIRKHFTQLVNHMGSTSFTYNLHFRAGGGIGANAMALPSGDIIITDELIELAENDREIIGVLAHEIVHVEKRHGMRSVLQNSGVFILLAAAMGDVTSMSSIGAALPTLLAQSGYSRKFETEADTGAGIYCLNEFQSTEPLQSILRKLHESHDGPSLGWISSHPHVETRITALQNQSIQSTHGN